MVVKIKFKDEIYIDFEIDEQDLHLLIGKCCRAAKRGNKYYLFNREDNLYIHRQIMDNPDGFWVDHIDNNPQNNKRSNLRLVTPGQNGANKSKATNTTSIYKGVCYYQKLNKYRAYINHNGKRINLGYYKTEVDAALAYNVKAIELFGIYANINPIA